MADQKSSDREEQLLRMPSHTPVKEDAMMDQLSNARKEHLLRMRCHAHDLKLRCKVFEATGPKSLTCDPTFKELQDVTAKLKKVFDGIEERLIFEALSSVAPGLQNTTN